MNEISLPEVLLKKLKPQLPRMVELLGELTEIESPTLEKAAADRCGGRLAEVWLAQGTVVGMVKDRERGDHLRVLWRPEGQKVRGQLMVLGHYDTVYPTGTLAKMPFVVKGGKAYGPGTFDMKAGIVQALFALKALQESQVKLNKRIVFLWTSDEEVGGELSRKLIEREARQSDAVFVLEPSAGEKGLLKTARKGVGSAEIVVHGRASHAGLQPEKGVNAIHELAAQIARIEKWNDFKRGVTISANVAEGGSRVNVTAEQARAIVDLRAWTLGDMERLEKRLHGLKATRKGATVEVHGGFERPPMEKKVSRGLFARAEMLAKQMGLKIGEAAVGGGSDGNFTAALGVPTLDGLGAVGDGAHSVDEHVVVKHMPERAALLGALLASS